MPFGSVVIVYASLGGRTAARVTGVTRRMHATTAEAAARLKPRDEAMGLDYPMTLQRRMMGRLSGLEPLFQLLEAPREVRERLPQFGQPPEDRRRLQPVPVVDRRVAGDERSRVHGVRDARLRRRDHA